MATPLYTPLDPSNWQFRVLRILPGSFRSTINCELQVHTTYAPPKYAALSYCWGDEHDRRLAVMNHVDITIAASLDEALQQLRAIDVELIWVDALCINQNDILERSLQVRYMRQIYSKAEMTYAWIGNVHLDNAALSLQFLQRIASGTIQMSGQTNGVMQRLRQKATVAGRGFGNGSFWTARNNNSVDYDHLFEALNDLFNRPYWQRRWIIQEAIVSKTTQIVCGGLMLSLDDMAQALGTCANRTEWTPRHDTSYRFLKRILDLRESYHNQQQPTLVPTILNTKDSLSKDERDKIFALIGICKDGDDLVPTPNYEESLETLSINLTKELLRRNAAFDMMFIHKEEYSLSDSLPSWCPNWLASNLPVAASTLCEKAPRLSLADAAFACQEYGPRLFAQGIAFGSVVAMSSVLSNRPHVTGEMARARKYTHEAQKINYYGLARNTALFVCLMASSVRPQRIPRKLRRFTCGFDLTLHSLIDLNRGKISGATPCWPLLDTWLNNNKNFLIGGRRLQDLTSRPARYYLARLTLPYRRRARLIIVTSICALTMTGAILSLMMIYSPGGAKTIPRQPGPVCVLALLVAIFLFWSALLLVHPYGPKKNTLSEQLLPRARLVLLDTGAIALANANTRTGDKLCLIAGCTSSVILRDSPGTSGEELHSVVGQSFVCMSRKDAKKYKAFCEVSVGQGTWTRKGLGDELEYKRLIEIYKKYTEWRTFVLI